MFRNESIADHLRKIALSILLDDTPSDKSIEEIRKKKPIRTKRLTKGDDVVSDNTLKPTAKPSIKPSRAEYKPSKWDSKQYRKENMREFRAQGKDIEGGYRYVKKRRKKKEG